METPTRMFLIRHGQVVNYEDGAYNGHRDVDITAHGVRQMEAVADRLRREPLTAIYCSDLIRTRKGAGIIAAHHGLIPQVLPALRELDVKQWEGLNADAVEERFPGAFDRWKEEGIDYRIPGGERIRDLVDRVIPVHREILSAHKGETVALVVHGGVNRVLLADALGAGFDRLYSIEQDFGCMNIVDYFDEYAVVRLINRRPLDGD